LEDLIFAMKVVKHTKSNGIALAKGKQTIGVGPGQTNRVTACKIAIEYGGERTKGAVLASDAFFRLLTVLRRQLLRALLQLSSPEAR